jgi:ABC-type transport system involved in multi-copper enzyme maturation permease subunit
MKMLIKFEILKFLKDKKFIIFFTIIPFFSFLTGFLLCIISPSDDKPSGFLLISNSLNFIYPFLCIFTSLFGSLTFSSEYEGQTLKMLLLGKFSRTKILINKIIFLFFVTFFLIFIFFLFNIFSGLIFSNFKGIEIQGYVLKKSSSLWLLTFLTFLLLIFSVYSFSLMGLFLSLIIKRIFPSVLITLIFYFSLIVLSIFPKIQNFLFPYYSNVLLDYFSKIVKGIDVSYFPFLYFFILVNFLYIFILIFFSIFLFKRMDL